MSDERLDRKGWANYLNQCKATVATEAASWFLERDDATVNSIRDYVLSKQTKGAVLRNDLGFSAIWSSVAMADEVDHSQGNAKWADTA